VAEPELDDVFSDDITVPATDGYPLAATLFLPRGAKRHAVLINSATAVPRKPTAALPATSPSAAARF
jgi:predicted alpha/beta hydrolase